MMKINTFLMVLIVVAFTGTVNAQETRPLAELVDSDADGICDPTPAWGPWLGICDLHNGVTDNCMRVANPDQADQDNDGIGDACDNDVAAPSADSDKDGIVDCLNGEPLDLCPPPPDGFACPIVPDEDAEEPAEEAADENAELASANIELSAEDLCPENLLSQINDLDGDGIGDACDPDTDNDGTANDEDCNCVDASLATNCESSNPSTSVDDQDGDGLPDALETLWGISDPNKADTDDDGIDDRKELLELGSNPSVVDSDQDGICDGTVSPAADNSSDSETDGEMAPCTAGPDNCPIVVNPDQVDTDEDGQGDLCQGDKDGDTFIDEEDNCPTVFNPGQENTDDHPLGDVCQAFATLLPSQSADGGGGCQLIAGNAATPNVAWLLLLGLWAGIVGIFRLKKSTLS